MLFGSRPPRGAVGATGRAAMKTFMLLAIGLIAVGAMLAPSAPAHGADPLDPTTIDKYVTPLVIPPVMPATSVIK